MEGGGLEIGSIVGRLVLKDEFSNQLEEAVDHSKKSISGLTLAMGALSGAVLAMGAAVLESVAHTAELRDEQTKAARAAGLSTEAYTKLAYAAKMSGVDTMVLGKSMRELLDPSDKARAMMTSLGVTFKDNNGHLLPQTQILGQLADKFKDMKNPAEKAQAAVQIFGNRASAMTNLLNEGSKGIEELGKKAEEMGLVFNDEAGKAAEKYADDLSDVHHAVDGLVESVGQSIIEFVNQAEIFKEIQEVISTFTQKWNGLDKETKNQIITIGAVTMAVAALTAGIIAAAAAFPIVAAAFKAAFITNPIGLILTGVALAIGAIIIKWKELTTWIRPVVAQFEELGRTLNELKKSAEPIADAISGIFKIGDSDNKQKIDWLATGLKAVFVPAAIGATALAAGIQSTIVVIKALFDEVKMLYGQLDKMSAIASRYKMIVKAEMDAGEGPARAAIDAFGESFNDEVYQQYLKAGKTAEEAAFAAFKGGGKSINDQMKELATGIKDNSTQIASQAAAQVEGILANQAIRTKKLLSDILTFDTGNKGTNKEKPGEPPPTGAPDQKKEEIKAEVVLGNTGLSEALASIWDKNGIRRDGPGLSAEILIKAQQDDKATEKAKKEFQELAKSIETVMQSAGQVIQKSFELFMGNLAQKIQNLQKQTAYFNYFSDIATKILEKNNQQQIEDLQKAENEKLKIMQDASNARIALLDAEFAKRKAQLDAEYKLFMKNARAEFNAKVDLIQKQAVNQTQAATDTALMEDDWNKYVLEQDKLHAQEVTDLQMQTNDQKQAETEAANAKQQEAAKQSAAEIKALQDKQAADEKNLKRGMALVNYMFALSSFKIMQQQKRAEAMMSYGQGVMSAWAAAMPLGPAAPVVGGIMTGLLSAILVQSLAAISSAMPPLPDASMFLAKGGYVKGPGTGTSDSVPAMISNGEFVVDAQRTQKMMSAIDNMSGGGIVINIHGDVMSDAHVEKLAQKVGTMIQRRRY